LAVDDRLTVPVICGPTGAGKSAIALWLAERFRVAIVVADSRQIYRAFDIGTAKPTAAERAAAPHRGIDVVDPPERYSAARWAENANRWIDEAYAAGRRPVVVGGTGFYIRALFEPLFDDPVLDSSRRDALQRFLAPLSLSELVRWTQLLDPERAHLGRAQLLRAIEVALLAGERVSRLHRLRARPARRRARYLVVDPGAGLAARIAERLDTMIDGGWVDEVRLLKDAVPAEAPAWKATGYRVMRDYVTGAMDWDLARNAILIETRQYAKRQRTWFRHQLDDRVVTQLDPTDARWQTTVERWWRETAPELEARHA
jgi:tRNA dimethylallyltransferase